MYGNICTYALIKRVNICTETFTYMYSISEKTLMTSPLTAGTICMYACMYVCVYIQTYEQKHMHMSK